MEAGACFAQDPASLLSLTDGRYAGTANGREGKVVRPAEPRPCEAPGGTPSFKVLSSRYLLGERD